MKISYSKVQKPFKSKKLAESFIDETRGIKNNKYDRAFAKKIGNEYFIMFFTFPDSLKEKCRAIEALSNRTKTPLGYHAIASKSIDWINAKYKSLTKTVL